MLNNALYLDSVNHVALHGRVRTSTNCMLIRKHQWEERSETKGYGSGKGVRQQEIGGESGKIHMYGFLSIQPCPRSEITVLYTLVFLKTKRSIQITT